MNRSLPVSILVACGILLFPLHPLPAFTGEDLLDFSRSWMTPAGPANQHWNRHNDGMIDQHDLYILIGEFHQPGPTPTPTAEPTPTPEVPSVAGTWVGELVETSGVPAVPDSGYIIAEVEQNGSSLAITMRPDDVVWTGTIEGNTLNASGLDNRGYPTSIEGTVSGDMVSGTYAGRDDGTDTDWSGNFELRRPGPRVDVNGIWVGGWEDQFDFYSQATHGTRLTEITQTGNRVSFWALVDDYGGDGYVEGNVVLFRAGPLVEGGIVTGDLYEGAYTWDTWDSSSWGTTFGERYVVGTTIDGSGDWFIDFTEIYSDKPSPKPSLAFDVTIIQSGNDFTLMATGFGTFYGLIYRDAFVTWGTSVEGDYVRIDGVVTGSSVAGTVEGEGYNPWWWGTYTGGRQ